MMIFKNYVCWQSEKIQRILNIEAIEPQDHIFLATHHPLKMKKSESIQGEDEISYTEGEFLRDFLQADDFAFVPVLGTSGTGKSHLIRWLAANIETTEQRKVLLIPKLGTNLKDIIGMILDLPELQGEKFDEYRKRLNQASSSLSEGEARQHLLNQLAIAVGDNTRRDYSKLTDEQRYLIKNLYAFLYDPFFREQWLKDEGIIHRLVIHILGYQSQVENIEERREFQIKDLPLNILYHQKAGEKAREFYSFLISNDEIQQATVKWLNQHLDEAITQVLNLGREDLQILMREVRQTLAKKQVELVLLIEDFAKLQGIDREILEAVLARPQQAGSQPLCAIRTALACTRGYFESLIETVRQRVTFTVDLDLGTVGDQALVTETDIQHFVARYLNAVRQDDSELKQWSQAYKEGDNRQPPSFCDECEHRQACHTGFGEVNGIGLYPFNSIALTQMRQRVNPGNFNPRILIKDVLKYTLDNSVDDLQQGCFPSVALQEHFGKMRLSAITQDDISNKDSQNADRRKILIDLWSDSNTLCDFPTEVHSAFNLPPLGVEVIKKKTTFVAKEASVSYQPSPQPSSTSEIPEKLAQKLEILNNWNNKAILPQEVEKDIREFVYPAVLERIEWDTEMLIRGSFAGSSQPFKQKNVLVHSPRVRGQGAYYSGIILSLPLNPDDETEFRETAIAFQGILLYSHYKHWNFENGDRYFRTYAKHLDRWSNYILNQIRRRPCMSGEYWNPVPATVELLALSSQMVGLPTHSIEDLINSLFLEPQDQENTNRSKSWKELFSIFQRDRSKLLDILKTYIGCTKGSVKTFQMIDAVQIIEPLKAIRKTWQPQASIPDDLKSEYQVIQRVRQKVDELLVIAVQEESDRQLLTYQALISEFDKDVKKKDIIDTVKFALEKAREAGVLGQKSAENLTEIIDQFSRTRFTGYVDTMQKIQNIIDNPDNQITQVLPYLGENHQKAISTTSIFLEATNNFLNTSISEAQNKIFDFQSTEEESINILHQSLTDSLDSLKNLLTEIKG